MLLISPKIVAVSTVQIFIISFMVSYLELEIPVPPIGDLRTWIESKIEYYCWSSTSEDSSEQKPSGSHTKLASKGSEKLVLTPKELAKYNGKKGSKGLYLAILGKVFDVQKGSKHYGPKGGYHFFAGRDATRAFVTGEFNEAGLRDDITDLSHQDILGIEEWIGFYDKEYKFMGYLEGTYYDSKGRETSSLLSAGNALKEAHKWQASQKKETERFPPCNSEWSQGKGGRVWCSNKSGGITREWVGVPRKLFKPGSSQSRCACVKNFGPPQDAESSGSHSDRGDLDNPNLQEYEKCNVDAISCNLPSS